MSRTSYEGKIGRFYYINKENLKEALKAFDEQLKPLREFVGEES